MKTKFLISLTFLFVLMIDSYFIQAQDLGSKMSSKEIKILIDSLSNALRNQYIYPEKAEIMVSNIKKKYKSGIYDKAKNRIELAMQLHNDLQEANEDRHMRIIYNPQMSTRIETPMTEDEKKQEQEKRINFARENNFSFVKTEILPGNIGYIRWDVFVDLIEEARPTMDAAFRFVNNCKALIIDMRYNHGGAPLMVEQTQNYFFDQKIHLNDIIYRGRDTVKRYTDPTKTDFKLNMPVYVLTSKGTFSGAEDFTYGMQQANRATIVGDTTGGGAHPTNNFSIGQGYVAFIPLGCAPRGKDWEGTGIFPNIPVSSEHALAKAQYTALTNLLNNSKNEMEKSSFSWQLNTLKSSEFPAVTDVSVLTNYTGVYAGGLNFYIKDQRLFCKNEERGNQIFELKPVSLTLFVLDENVQVEFEKDTSGTWSKMKMYWRNGMITEKRKI